MENKELIEYLEQKFKAIDNRFDKIDEQLDRLEHKTSSLAVAWGFVRPTDCNCILAPSDNTYIHKK